MCVCNDHVCIFQCECAWWHQIRWHTMGEFSSSVCLPPLLKVCPHRPPLKAFHILCLPHFLLFISKMFPKPLHTPLSFLSPSPISPFLPSHSLSGPFHTSSPIKSVLTLFHTIHTIYTIPTSKAYQISPLLWLPHIYTSLSIQSTSWHNLIANRNLFLKRNLPFQNERYNTRQNYSIDRQIIVLHLDNTNPNTSTPAI